MDEGGSRFYVTEFEAQRQEILSDFCTQHPEIENIPENRDDRLHLH